MKVEIENYRGWDIYFDTDKESFYAASEEYDRGETKKTFAAAKKYIDDFIKENIVFEPVWIERPSNYSQNRKKIKLIGIRKDKRFVYEDEKGNQQQLSDYNEKDYILVNNQNDPIYNQIDALQEKKSELDKQIKALESQLIREGLSEIKSKFTT